MPHPSGREQVAILGVGQTRYGRRDDVNTLELVYEAVQAALQDAGVGIGDIEAAFFGSAPDALIGVSLPDQWCVGAAGALHKPFMRISTGGSTGSSTAIAAYDAIASGHCHLALAVAVERANESNAVQLLMNTNFDPIYEREFAINAISCYALATVDHMVRYGTTEEQLAKISVRNHVNALNNPHAHLKLRVTVEDVLQSRMLCWPVKLLDTCPRSDGACALVLASAARARDAGRAAAWFHGLQSYSDGYFLGEREILSHREHLQFAAREAYRQAGVSDPRRQIDVAELQNPFTISEVMAIEALGFCDIGGAGEFVDAGVPEMEGDLPINPSGGVLSSNPVGASSMVRLAEAALQVMGKAGARQIAGVRRALAQASGGSIQFGTVAILGREPVSG